VEVHSRVAKKMKTPKMWEDAVAEMVPEKEAEIKAKVEELHSQASKESKPVLDVYSFTFR
jgi:hypothetical protein